MIWASCALVLILAVAATIELGVRLLQLLFSFVAPRPLIDLDEDGQSTTPSHFVSVHVATYNEPPRLVIETMRNLATSRFSDFEVVIVDNNTSDPALWSPVADAVKALGERFRFVHVDRLSGAKAGALNVALSLSDARTTHVAIVDADYQVDEDFLSDAVRSLTANGVDYVQFPQAYRGGAPAAEGVEHELGDYFACFAGGAGRPGSMLPTGTLSLFTVSALRSVGGWPTETITEDAEIGVRLQAAGYRGLWLARDRGRGLLPVDLRGLRKQRARWAAGNLQVLKRLHRFDWLSLNVSDLLNLVVQLTAWISLLLPAALALMLVGIAGHFPLSGIIAGLSALTILGSAVLTALRMVVLRSGLTPLRVRLEAFATRIALTWTSALAWIPALSTRALTFHRTAKSVGSDDKDGEPTLAATSAAFLAVGTAFILHHQYFEAAACLLLSSIWICARRVDANLRRAAALNPELC